MKTRKNENGYNESTLVTFHIGRGGRFNNSGHVKFVDSEKSILKFTDDLFDKNRDERGRFCATYLADGNGNTVMDSDDFSEAKKTGVGVIDIDGEYDTTYTITLGECSETEADAVLKYNPYDCDSLIATMVELGRIDESYLTIEDEE